MSEDHGITAFKKCGMCGAERVLDQFSRCSASPDGRQGYCKPCAATKRKKWMEDHPDAAGRYVERDRERYGEEPEFREKKMTRAGQYRKKHPEVAKRSNAKWRERMYGLTVEDYDRMVAERKGRCDCCGRKPRKLVVDHDHKTGIVRGLLCQGCNPAIGKLGDDVAGLQRAIDYLQRASKTFEPLTFIA